MTDAERARAAFMQCLALATGQYGMSASPSDTVAAAVTYFNAMSGVAEQCQPSQGDGAAKPDGTGRPKHWDAQTETWL